MCKPKPFSKSININNYSTSQKAGLTFRPRRGGATHVEFLQEGSRITRFKKCVRRGTIVISENGMAEIHSQPASNPVVTPVCNLGGAKPHCDWI